MNYQEIMSAYDNGTMDWNQTHDALVEWTKANSVSALINAVAGV